MTVGGCIQNVITFFLLGHTRPVFLFFPYRGRNLSLIGFQNFGRVKNFPIKPVDSRICGNPN
jgi:hypothetical protein